MELLGWLSGAASVVAARSSTRYWRPLSAAQWVNQAGGSLRDQILARDRYTCRACGRPATHVDHVVPVARGGTDHPSNLRALCAGCNLEKGAGLDLTRPEE